MIGRLDTILLKPHLTKNDVCNSHLQVAVICQSLDFMNKKLEFGGIFSMQNNHVILKS